MVTKLFRMLLDIIILCDDIPLWLYCDMRQREVVLYLFNEFWCNLVVFPILLDYLTFLLDYTVRCAKAELCCIFFIDFNVIYLLNRRISYIVGLPDILLGLYSEIWKRGVMLYLRYALRCNLFIKSLRFIYCWITWHSFWLISWDVPRVTI